MQNPVVVDCPQNQWTKVVNNGFGGIIHNLDFCDSPHLYTYRVSGEPEPIDREEGVYFSNGIEYQAGIDVYIYSILKSIKVRVDSN